MRLAAAFFCMPMLLLAISAQDKPTEPAPVVLRLAISVAPRTLDPHMAGDVISMEQCAHAYEAPLEYDPFTPGKLRPCLLASMPVASADGLEWTLTLRDDLRFADNTCFPESKGRKVIASDLVFSWKRLMALPKSGGSWLIDGQIAGLDEFRATARRLAPEGVLRAAWWKHLDKPVAGLTVMDDLMLKIKLVEPRGDFIHLLASTYLAALPREATELDMFDRFPVGTGPFVLADRTEDSLRWTRNANYRRVTLEGVPESSPLRPFAGRVLPLVDEVRYVEIAELSGRVSALCEGRIHRAAVAPKDIFDPEAMNANKPLAEALSKELRERGLVPVRCVEPTLEYLAFNMGDAQLGTRAGEKGRALRKALALSYDRERLIRELNPWGSIAANALTRPGIVGHSDKARLAMQRHDPTEGRKLLAAAGFKVNEEDKKWVTTGADGKQVEVRLSLRDNSELGVAEGKVITACWADVGVACKVECMTFMDFLKQQEEGLGQIYDAGWVYDIPDATNMLQLLYGPNKAADLNHAGFEDKDFDKHYQEMLKLAEDGAAKFAKRAALNWAMHAIIDAETPWITASWRVSCTLAAKELAAPEPDVFRYGTAKYMALK